MIIQSNFKPAWYLRNKHLQTILPKYRKQIDIELTKERLETPDDDFLDLVWTQQTDGPIVVLLHGLEGNIDSHYSKSLLNALSKNGWSAVLMHFRGCSGEANKQARGYHSGETGDMHFLFENLHKRFPDTQLAAIGISMGGNALLKYLGENKEHYLTAACAVSVPFELAKSAETLKHGFARLYQKHLIDSLQKQVRKKFEYVDCPVDIQELEQWNDFYTLDDNLTAPLHGFKGADDYYTQSSSRQYLKNHYNTKLNYSFSGRSFFTNIRNTKRKRTFRACHTRTKRIRWACWFSTERQRVQNELLLRNSYSRFPRKTVTITTQH